MYPYYLINTDFFQLNLYGLLMFIGIISALVVFDVYTTKRGMSASSQRFFLLASVASIAAGVGSSILFQSFYNFIESGFKEWSWNSGMTFLGGLIGGVVTFLVIFLIWNKIKKGKYTKDLSMVAEVLAASVTGAHFFGRLGCFTAGCCYGKETSSIFGMHFPYLEGYVGDVPPDLYVHPTQLYEAFALLILFFLCSWLFFRHPKYSLPTYLAGYGVARFVLEFFRDDPRGELVGNTLYPSQQISLAMMIAGVVWLIVLIVLDILRRGKTTDEEAFVIESLDGAHRKFTYRKGKYFFTVSERGGALYAYGADGADCISKGVNDPLGLIGLPFVSDSLEDAVWHVRRIADGMKLSRAFFVEGEENAKLSAIVTMTLDENGALCIDCRARTEIDTMCGLFPLIIFEADECESGNGVWNARSAVGELTIDTAPQGIHTERCGLGTYHIDCRNLEELRKGEEYSRTVVLNFVPSAREDISSEQIADVSTEQDAGAPAQE